MAGVDHTKVTFRAVLTALADCGCPNATVEEDADGQVVICTNKTVKLDSNGREYLAEMEVA